MAAYKDEERGTWYVSFYYEDWTGAKKRKVKRGFRTKKEALNFESEYKRTAKADMDMTMGEFVEVYFRDKAQSLKDRSIKNKRDTMNAQLLPYFKDRPMNSITPAEIIQWQNTIIEKGYSDDYLKTIQNQMTALFNHAKNIYNLADKREALDFERSKKLSNERSMDMKLSDFIEIYFSDKQNDLKDRTIKNKRYMMQQHIVPYFGNQMMSEIKASQIIQWQNEIQKKGYSDSYLRMIQNQLTSLFTHAAKIYDLPVNPCKKVKRMGNSDSRSLNFWTLDEYKQFIQTMEPGTRYYLMFEMLFWTGCRIGELLAITKADINFEKNQLSINKTYYRTGMQDIITEPKTKQSFRTIEIPEFLKEEIKEFIDGHYGMPDTERLFPVVQEAVQHKMKRQIELAGVKNIRVHDLRHSHVAYLIEKGVEPLLIRDRLGHKDIRITLNTYGHLYPNQQRKIANLLDNENGNAVIGLGEEKDEC